jgi:hypothetical protein
MYAIWIIVFPSVPVIKIRGKAVGTFPWRPPLDERSLSWTQYEAKDIAKGTSNALASVNGRQYAGQLPPGPAGWAA